jgi:hypothetical protein
MLAAIGGTWRITLGVKIDNGHYELRCFYSASSKTQVIFHPYDRLENISVFFFAVLQNTSQKKKICVRYKNVGRGCICPRLHSSSDAYAGSCLTNSGIFGLNPTWDMTGFDMFCLFTKRSCVWLIPHLRSLPTVVYNSWIHNYIWIATGQIAQDATDAGIYLLQNHSPCFGCPSHPSSGLHKTATAASGTCHSIWVTTFLQRDLICPRWRKVVTQILWPVPEAAVTVLCTPDDGCDGHPKHVEWFCSN